MQHVIRSLAYGNISRLGRFHVIQYSRADCTRSRHPAKRCGRGDLKRETTYKKPHTSIIQLQAAPSGGLMGSAYKTRASSPDTNLRAARAAAPKSNNGVVRPSAERGRTTPLPKTNKTYSPSYYLIAWLQSVVARCFVCWSCKT